MKTSFFSFLLIFCFSNAVFNNANAQDSNLGVTQSGNRLTTKSLMKYDDETAYLSKSWEIGRVNFLNGKFQDLPINFNAYNMQLEYQKGQEKLTFDMPVKSFILGDTSLQKGHLFLRGFFATDQQDESSFYEVVHETKNFKLLKFARFKTREKRGLNEANTTVLFDLYEDYYLAFSTNQLQKLKKSKKEMVTLFPSQASEIEQFISEKSLKFKAWEDVIAVLDFVENKF